MTTAPFSDTMLEPRRRAPPHAVRFRSIVLVAASVALFGAAMGVAHRIRVAAEAPYDVSFVPGAGAMRWLSLGHPTLVANVWWLRAVQYIGEPRGDARGWDRLAPMLELVTDLDPRHGYAYQVGGGALARAGRIAESNAILEKGARNVPDRYILPFHRAVNAFLYDGDYALAGRWFEIASRTPGAPPHLRDYVVSMYVKGDAAEAAVAFLDVLEREAQDADTVKAIREQKNRAVLERDADAIEAAAETYRARFGIRPFSIEQLVVAGLIPALPADPFGGSYYLDDDGRVRSTRFSKRYARPPTGEARNRELQVERDRLRALDGSVR